MCCGALQAASRPGHPHSAGLCLPWSKAWTSFTHILSIPPSLPLPGHQGKALPVLHDTGSPLDKPHPQGELILATAGVVHAISSALPTDKKRLMQKLPPLWSGLLENLSLPLSIPGLCTLE